jgi:hypothetical protein
LTFFVKVKNSFHYFTMLKKLGFLPIFALLASAPALANTETVTFTGTSAAFCTVTKSSDGTLAQSLDSTSLSTTNTGGSPATFTAASNASASLDLDDALTVTTEPSPAGFTAVRTQSISVTDDATSATLYSGDGAAGATASIDGTVTGSVNLSITDSDGGLIPAGSYGYTKTITCSTAAP